MKIWLDDVRNAPDDSWVIARSVNDAKKMIWLCYLARNMPWCSPIEMISLDHDMGDYAKDGGDGIKLLEWMVERGFIYPVQLHTMNAVGRENMQRIIDKHWKDGLRVPEYPPVKERKYRRRRYAHDMV